MSAVIYQFPTSARVARTGRDEPKPAANFSSRVSEVVFSGAWYHEEAIEETKPVRKN